MVSFLKQFLSDEKGQALPIVLCLLAIGGLTIGVSLNHITTVLKGQQILTEDLKGAYAAGAGVEYVLWSLGNGMLAPTQLPDSINQLTVNMQTVEKGYYTLYFRELIEPGDHTDWLDVDGEIVEEGGAYKFIITVTWQPESGAPVIHLEEVGARIPVGYSYQPESAASFAENLSNDEPEELLGLDEAYLLSWELPPPLPDVSDNETVKTQSFYITGEGNLEEEYAWVVASREDIGVISEIYGALYEITATATSPDSGRTTARIVADIIKEPGIIHILSWQISN
ncbi:hypothetical protein ACFLTG_02520 [Chloroflexota bacterium]